MKLFAPIAIVLFLTINGVAQKDSVSAEPIFYGSNQPTVKKLPLPKHPALSGTVKLSGRVSVAVTVDEKGKVTSADDADGPYPICKSVTDPTVSALRNAAIDAAKKAIFTPAMIDNRAVAATGRIAYDFMSERPKSDGSGSKGVEMRLDRLTKLGDPEMGARLVDESASSQDSKSGNGVSPSSSPGQVSGGVLQGRAMELGKPKYPVAARAVKAGGQVGVQVLIDVTGNVHSAAAISGHPLLRQAAEIAACGSRFLPTLLDGQPVKVSGVINYNFVP
ncbi:MAG TPA: energy transducer TonB [Pyrinomonadaceae bacterium]|nr:energy transducer TonB [Pyrinomonadaceae bacterium]